jgi:subtilisin family serine protease
MSADVIQLSIWNYGISPLSFQNALKEALDKGVIIVGVTGNSWDDPGTSGVLYPGKFPEVIATGSISSSLRVSYFSRRGSETEICAPGSDLPSIGELSGSGTSFAAPHVSGCIALMKTMNQSLTPNDIRRILTKTSTDLGTPGRDDVYGYGLLNVTNAVRGAAGMQTWNLTKDIIPTTGTTETTESTSTSSQSSETISSSQSTSSAQTSGLLILEVLLITLILVRRKKSR